MNTSVLNIKTDPQTKQQLKEFAAQLGLPVSALLNAQIKQMLRSGQVIFDVNLEPTNSLRNLIKEAETDYKTGKNITATTTDEETLELLRSQ